MVLNNEKIPDILFQNGLFFEPVKLMQSVKEFYLFWRLCDLTEVCADFLFIMRTDLQKKSNWDLIRDSEVFADLYN